MISSDSIRGYNDVIILSILNEGDSYGYEVSKEIRTRTNELYMIKETTLYSAFTRLEKQKFIRSYPGDLTHGKKKNLLYDHNGRKRSSRRKKTGMAGSKTSC